MSLVARRNGALLPAPVVDRPVGDVAERDVQDEHEQGERDGRRRVLLEEDREQHGEEDGRDPGPLGSVFPGRRAVEAGLPLEARLLLAHRTSLACCGGLRRSAVVGRSLDDPGRVAAVLAGALALRLSHQDDCERSSASSMLRRFRSGISAGKSASAAAGARPTSSASATGARAEIRATISASGAAVKSCTFIETWARPLCSSSRPIARTPGSPPPLSRSSAAIARASPRSSLASSTLNAISGGRAVPSVAPAVG